jgi:hypothetical protein
MVTYWLFLYLLCAAAFCCFWHAREFVRHATHKRVKLAQLVLFAGPLGWVAFVGREWGIISPEVAHVLEWAAVGGSSLHVLFIYAYASQVRR